MEFKEFIEKPRTLTAKINLKEAQLEALKTQSLYAVSVPSQTPGGNQHYDSVIEKHVAKQDELERLIPSLKQEREGYSRRARRRKSGSPERTALP